MKKKEFSLADYELFKSVDNMLFSVSCRIKIVENIKSLFNFSLLFAVFVYFLSFVYLLIPRLGYLWACYYFIYILKIKKFALIADPFNFITFCDGCMIVCSKIAIIVYLFFLTFLRMTFYLFLVDPFLRVWLVLITNLTRFMFLFFLLISFSLTKAKINFIFKENKFFMSTIKTSHLKLGALNVLISKENFLIYLILEMNRIAEVRKTYFGIQTIEEITIEKG